MANWAAYPGGCIFRSRTVGGARLRSAAPDDKPRIGGRWLADAGVDPATPSVLDRPGQGEASACVARENCGIGRGDTPYLI